MARWFFTFLSECGKWDMLTQWCDTPYLKDASEPSSSSFLSEPSSSASSSSSSSPLSYLIRPFPYSTWRRLLLHNLLGPFRVHEPFPVLRVPPVVSFEPEMSLAFRFTPGPPRATRQIFRLPSTLDERFSLHSLGLSSHSKWHSDALLFPYSRLGSGLRGLVNDPRSLTNVFIDAFTYHKGEYGRYFVLISVGIGCTVWSTFAPAGFPVHAHEYADLFTEFDSYDHFLNKDYRIPGYRRKYFLERRGFSSSLVSAMADDLQLRDMTIPTSSGPVLMGVGLGVMLVILLTAGIAPELST